MKIHGLFLVLLIIFGFACNKSQNEKKPRGAYGEMKMY